MLSMLKNITTDVVYLTARTKLAAYRYNINNAKHKEWIMDYQLDKEIGRVFESVDFLSDDFENYGFDEGSDDLWEDESHLSSAIRELDDSLGIIEFHQ